ncbi:hypothetical protein BGX27_006186 [Mortierella sp. AM989]|nr:hypothetical protein BGX27_006186 [Mortierella sp. AM989]
MKRSSECSQDQSDIKKLRVAQPDNPPFTGIIKHAQEQSNNVTSTEHSQNQNDNVTAAENQVSAEYAKYIATYPKDYMTLMMYQHNQQPFDYHTLYTPHHSSNPSATASTTTATTTTMATTTATTTATITATPQPEQQYPLWYYQPYYVAQPPGPLPADETSPTTTTPLAEQQYPFWYYQSYYAVQPKELLPADKTTPSLDETAPSFGTSVGFPSLRTIYLGNIPPDATIHEVLDLVRTGNIETAKLLPEKSCAFISFIDPAAASAFRSKATLKRLHLGGRELKVGWGKATPVPTAILEAVERGATRNVYIGNIDETFTKEKLLADFSVFGAIDDIKIIKEKAIAFVHFTHINNAIKAVGSLPKDARYGAYRIGYGKDRCAKFPVAASDDIPAVTGQVGSGVPMAILSAENKRTVYLGNIPPEATCENLCNVIRGGILSKIRFIPSRHIAFVTFVDPEAASAFMESATSHGITMKTRQLKVGWGQKVNTLPNEVIQAFSSGATRNVYIGGIEGVADEEKLRKDFSEFGEVELVNLLPEKNCGFVNFTDVLSAVKAIKEIKKHPDYEHLVISYGKDRCGNPPREIMDKGDNKVPRVSNDSDSTSEKKTADATNTTKKVGGSSAAKTPKETKNSKPAKKTPGPSKKVKTKGKSKK